MAQRTGCRTAEPRDGQDAEADAAVPYIAGGTEQGAEARLYTRHEQSLAGVRGTGGHLQPGNGLLLPVHGIRRAGRALQHPRGEVKEH